jgi:hypothetical protein
VNDDGEDATNAALIMATRDELKDAEIEIAREVVRSGPGH